MWNPYSGKITNGLDLLSLSDAENVSTSQRYILRIPHKDPHQCELFHVCGPCSAGPHAPCPRQCAALLMRMMAASTRRLLPTELCVSSAGIYAHWSTRACRKSHKPGCGYSSNRFQAPIRRKCHLRGFSRSAGWSIWVKLCCWIKSDYY